MRNSNTQDNADLVFALGNTGDEPIAGDWDGLPFRIVGSGDFNAEGKADILWHNSTTNETQIWLVNDRNVIG